MLEVRNLTIDFHTMDGIARAINGVNFSLFKKEKIGIVGESGCGKSVTVLGIMGLLQKPPAKVREGQVLFKGRDLLTLPEREFAEIRGSKISMIFQNPMTSLNPVFTIGNQMGHVIRIHQGLRKKESIEKAIELLQEVGIPSPEKRIDEYPHQLSGGMRQRVMIAMAISCRPQLIIADEPTTALDVTIQAQIIDVIQDIIDRFESSLILITHDLAVVAETVERVLVMYAGKIVETGSVQELFESPKHPYTQGLLGWITNIETERGKLPTIDGMVPSIFNLPEGCSFSNRCKQCIPICIRQEPPNIEIKPGVLCRCWLYSEER